MLEYQIYEGTNEINRLLIVKMILKKDSSGDINLMKSVKEVVNEIMEIPSFKSSSKELFEVEKIFSKILKKLFY